MLNQWTFLGAKVKVKEKNGSPRYDYITRIIVYAENENKALKLAKKQLKRKYYHLEQIVKFNDKIRK